MFSRRSFSTAAFTLAALQRTQSLKDQGYDGEVRAVYVLREFQKRKLGTRLFHAMSSDLQRRGFEAA